MMIAIILGLVAGLFFLSYRLHCLKKQASKILSLHQLDLAKLRDQMAQTISYDSLTGLPSRQLLLDRLETTRLQSERYNLLFGVMFLDIDGFKMINDALGHDIGDLLLKEIAERLSKCIRQVDTVSHYSGDEFVFILPQLAKPESAAYVAQRFLEAVSQPIRIQEHELFVTASIGIAVYPLDGQDAQTLLKNADNALHQTKTLGRNRYQFYQKEMSALSQRELMLDADLRSDAIYDDLIIYYQPQIDVKTQEVVCRDAILRWQHPTLGLLEFEDFIRLAENNGRVIAIGEWFLQKVCHEIAQWKSQAMYSGRVAIKISPKQLENTHFIQKISTLLKLIPLEPTSLVLEIAETAFLGKLDWVENSIYMLKQLGVKIAIGHFGRGHLSLQQLHRFSPDILKMDKVLIDEITMSSENESLVKIIMALANSLHQMVVAIGVNTVQQQALLERLGCSVMQGQLFGCAVLADTLKEPVKA